MTVPPSRSAPDRATDRATDRVAHRLAVRRLTVVRTEELGPGMRRVVLGGPDLAGFAAPGPTDHVKLFVPARPGADLALPVVADGVWTNRRDPALTYREYTVRTHAPDAGELVLEMVTGEHGPASQWAARAVPGQEVGVLGPKTSVLRPLDRARYVLAADASGLPALRNWLALLPPTAQVTTLIDDGRTGPLADGVERLLGGWTADGGSQLWWAAAEADQVHRIRAAVLAAGIGRESVSMTAYWRRGVAHFDHKAPQA